MRVCLAIARPTGQPIGWPSPCGRLPREERLQVAIDRVTALPLPPCLHLTHRLMGVASSPEPVAVLAEVAVIERCQDLGNGLLNHSIQHRGHSEGPLVFHWFGPSSTESSGNFAVHSHSGSFPNYYDLCWYSVSHFHDSGFHTGDLNPFSAANRRSRISA
jgi:hypothetical protein